MTSYRPDANATAQPTMPKNYWVHSSQQHNNDNYKLAKLAKCVCQSIYRRTTIATIRIINECRFTGYKVVKLQDQVTD